MNTSVPEQINFDFDKSNLYREESVTDLQVGAIRQLIPIKPDGSRDESRDIKFIGHTQLRSPQGLVPIQQPLEATDLEKAFDEFPGAMKKALEEVVKTAQQMQAQQEAAQRANESRPSYSQAGRFEL